MAAASQGTSSSTRAKPLDGSSDSREGAGSRGCGDSKQDTVKSGNCGRHHADGACRAKDRECMLKCSKKGHISKMCWSTSESRTSRTTRCLWSLP